MDVASDYGQMSKAKKIFAIGVKKLKNFEEIQKTRPLTKEEQIQDSDIRFRLYSQIERYAFGEIKKNLKSVRVDSDAEQTVLSRFKDKFFAILPTYDYTKAEPTVFCKHCVKEAIRTYTNECSQHMSQTSAKHLTAINGVIKEFEAAGIDYDDELIHTKLDNSPTTSISTSVIKKVRRIAAQSMYVGLSDVHDVSTEFDPLALRIKTDDANALHDIMSNCLSPDEIDFYLVYKNFEGTSHKTYKEMMSLYDMQEHEVKAKLNHIKSILSTEVDNLMKINNQKNAYNTDLDFLESSLDEIEEALINLTNDV